MPQPAQVTAAEISRLAGVTRATVSNWRRRHPDFPAPSGGTETSPAYDLSAVRAWLAGRGQLPDGSPADDLRNALRSDAPELAHRSRLLPLAVEASRLPDTDVVKAADSGDEQLSDWAGRTSRSYLMDMPGAWKVTYSPDDAGLLRVLLQCLVEEGAAQTLEVLAEGDGGDSRAGGAYRTPPPVAELMAALLRGAGEAYPGRVFDPACGMGGLLLAALGQGSREVSGQDVVETLAAHAAARLAVAARPADPHADAGSAAHAGTDADAGTVVQVRVGDSLRDDAFATSVADAVLCAPPYGHREWGHEDLAYDSRWVFGLPPKGESELAWVQHCLGHLTEGGRAVLLMPPGAALRPSGRRIRAEMVRRGALRAVVGLPPGVAVPLHIGLHLWILERQHPQAALPSTVLMVDAAGPESRTGDETDGRHSSTGWSTVRELVVGAWRDFDRHPEAFDPVQGVAQAVAVIDLLDEAVDLSPARHVRAVPVAAEPDELAETAYQVRGRLRRAATGLVTLTGGGVWPPAGAESRSWRTASVADLLRGDALTLLRAPTTVRTSGPARTGGDLPATLTARDVVTRRPASGEAEEEPSDGGVTVEVGDVVLPEMLHEGVGVARVVDARDAGHRLGRHLHLLRPDPTRLDPWFLAGFLAAEDNLNAASSGTSVVRVDPRRLRVPLLPLPEQQRYGQAFRHLHALRVAADLADRLADETARVLAAGLTGGALLPPEGPR